jgi:hypothetical protein
MSFFKRVTGALDAEVNSFTKILQRQRTPLQIAPSGTGQGVLFGLGLTSMGNAMSPEATLASLLKEWVGLRRWSFDSQVSVLESRVLGSKYVHPDGMLTLEQWLQWRLPLQFPQHQLIPANGWTPEFYTWAITRAEEHFTS